MFDQNSLRTSLQGIDGEIAGGGSMALSIGIAVALAVALAVAVFGAVGFIYFVLLSLRLKRLSGIPYVGLPLNWPPGQFSQ